jgi:diguanylate cyclase (GGDEF)-like protein/PAS domain S-box-containing protein
MTMSIWQSLTGRLFRWVFGWYLVLAILVTGVQLALEYSSINKSIDNDLESLGHSFQMGIADAVWSFDHAQVEALMRGLVQASAVTGARVEAAGRNAVTVAGGIPGPDAGSAEDWLIGFQRRDFPLNFRTPRGEERLVGTLTLYSDRSVALARLRYSFIVIIVNSLIKTAGLWLIFYLVITRVLARPLRRITDVVSRIEGAANTVEPIAIDHPHDDELGRLLRATQRMQERLIVSRQELEATNQHLEELVAARTRSLQDSERRLSLALAAANEAWWDWDFQTGSAVLSPSYFTMLGYAVDEFPSTYAEWRRHVHPDDIAEVESQQRQAMVDRREDHVEMTYRMRGKDGSWRWINSQADVIQRDDRGMPWRVIGTNLDVTRQRADEFQLRLAASVFAHAQEGICITDAQERIVDVNPRFCELTGYAREAVLGKTPRILKSGHQTPDFYAAMWQTIARDGHWQGEVWNRNREGRLYAERLTISAVTDSRNVVTHYVGVLSDITVDMANRERLERIAHYDVLTGVPNRALLADRLRQAIAQTRRTRTLLAVCYLDLDGFKAINDQYGHDVGDQVLVEVAERLRICLRGGDTVARLGGDEFVLLLLGLDHVDECRTALERMLEALNRPIQAVGDPVGISASIGVTVYPVDDADPDALLRHADLAMYQAKQQGKNRYHMATFP